MGNVEIMKRGDIQLTSAGTGIRHSEMTHGPDQVHFLQIWFITSTRGLIPKYFHLHFTDNEKRQGWVSVVREQGKPGVSGKRDDIGPTPVHSPLTLYSTLLASGKTAEQSLARSKGYIHVIQTKGYNVEASRGNKVKVNGVVELDEGDGVFITNTGDAGQAVRVENIGSNEAEILLFDLD